MERKVGSESDNRWEGDGHGSGLPSSTADVVTQASHAEHPLLIAPQSVSVPSEAARMVHTLAAAMPSTLAQLIPRADPTPIDATREFPLRNIVSSRDNGSVDIVVAGEDSILCWHAAAPSKLKTAKLVFWRAVPGLRCVHLVEQDRCTASRRTFQALARGAQDSCRKLGYVSDADLASIALVSLESPKSVRCNASCPERECL
jgi:hypothetical protein